MSTIKKVLALCLSFVMLCTAAVYGAAPKASAEEDGGWTIFVYLCGTDLESDGGCATGDLEEMLEATYSDDVQLVIETGGANSWYNDIVDPDTLERYVRTEDGISFVEDQPAADMGESSTLADFLKWGTETYASKHMGLVFWNHGGGSISGVCFDERNEYNSLSVSDINTALSETVAATGAHFDFIGFDACLMATLETANMLVPYADYMYASEEVEPGSGWNYTDILNYLAENPDADGRALGEVQCQSYYDYCMEDGDDPTVTFSIIDLSKISDLVSAFDKASQELYESDNLTPIVRGILNADNFGGNNKTEGYTNMVDLGDMLRNISDYAPSAQEALSALNDAVIFNKNASRHQNAAGLSIYYPLSVQGSTELSIFRDICPSTYYLALVDMAAAGADLSISSEGTGMGSIENSETLEVLDVYLDEDGIYTVELNNMDDFAYASCSLYAEFDEDFIVYLGEDDDVIIYYDDNVIQDNFDGYWLTLEGEMLPIELVTQYDTTSLYACHILLNGEETNLQIIYDWDAEEFQILGTWEGINSDSGMAARAAEPLKEGDVINLIYDYTEDFDSWDSVISNDITVPADGNLLIEYELLPAADYYYSINVYDIYGNGYALDYTIFNVDEDGEISFYIDE